MGCPLFLFHASRLSVIRIWIMSYYSDASQSHIPSWLIQCMVVPVNIATLAALWIILRSHEIGTIPGQNPIRAGR